MSGYTSIVDAAPAFVPGTFDAQDVRLAAAMNVLPGLFESGDFAVTERGAGANMSVDIAAGRCVLTPGDVARQGNYVAWMGSSYNTSSDGGYTWTAADGSNPRIDLLCIEARDTDFSGSYTGFKFRIIDGTPNASATHQLATTYWPAIPTGCVPIAAIKIPAGDSAINTTDITNLNPIGGHRSSYMTKHTSAETTTSTSYTRLTTPDFVTVYVPHADCRLRVFSEGWWKISVASGTQGIALFLNDTQLKSRSYANGAPITGGYEIASLGTYLSRFTSYESAATSTTAFFLSVTGATSDISDVTTGAAGGSGASAIEVGQLAAGWYVIEQRYKTSANTLTVDERRMWAEVIG